VAPAASFLFNLNAWSSGSADDDEFIFSWSTDNAVYTDFLTVSATDPENSQLAMLPNNLNGTVYIRVRDSDRTPGHKGLDTVFIDHMYIHAENAQGSPPDAPSGLGASVFSASSIALIWTDNSADELGFELQRSTDLSNWTGLPTTEADVTDLMDTGLVSSTTYHYRIRAINQSGSSAWVGGASATTDAGPPPPDISLTLLGSKKRGKHVIDLNWTGSTTGNVDIYRDGGLLTTITDDGSHTDNTSNKGGRSYTYQVCEAGTANCSAVESVVF
jgi:titin